MSGLSGDLALYAGLIVAAAIPNGVWRWLAVFATARLDDASPVFIWVKHVATCLIAGVVAQLIIAPPGALANVPISVRIGALLFAGAVWLIGRNVYVAWAASVFALAAAAALL